MITYPDVRVSPAEPPEIREMGVVSAIPEKHGYDILFPGAQGLIGIQRKTYQDFIASLRDGRLQKELGQMAAHVSLLILEGSPMWKQDGEMVTSHGFGFDRDALHSILLSIQVTYGVHWLQSNSLRETVLLIDRIYKWSRKDRHDSLKNRPHPGGAQFGKKRDLEAAKWFLMGFPGIGHKVAEDILAYFKEIPLKWSVPVEQLQKVPGLGKKRIGDMTAFLERIHGK